MALLLDSSEGRLLASPHGWAHEDSLMLLDTRTDMSTTIPIAPSKFVMMERGSSSHFLLNYCEPKGYASVRLIEVRPFDSPTQVVSRCRISPSSIQLEGDLNVWERLPRAHVVDLGPEGGDFAYVVWLHPKAGVGDWIPLTWWNDESYDRGYQSVLSAVEIPGTDKVIIPVQRDSCPIIFDLRERRAVGRITLSERRGNPRLFFRRLAPEVWADDYDTLVRLDSKGLVKTGSVLLQPSDASGARQFIGDFAFATNEGVCAVARPFSGDILAVDPETLRPVAHAKVRGQPFTVAVLSNGKVYSQDWHSGRLLKGQLSAGSPPNV